MNKNDPPKRGLTTGNLLDFYAQQTGKIPGSPQLRRVSSNEEANVHLIRSEVEENQSSDNLIKSAQENSTKEEIFVLHQRENELQEILLKIEGNVPTNNIFNLLYEWVNFQINNFSLSLF